MNTIPVKLILVASLCMSGSLLAQGVQQSNSYRSQMNQSRHFSGPIRSVERDSPFLERRAKRKKILLKSGGLFNSGSVSPSPLRSGSRHTHVL